MPYVSLKTEPLFVLLWLYGVSVGQENPCGKSLLGSSCRESFGRNQQRTQGSLWGHVSVQGHGAAVCQCWKEGISWTPGSLDTRGSAGHQRVTGHQGISWTPGSLCQMSVHELPGCGIFRWQELGSAVVVIYLFTTFWVVFMLSWCWAAAPWNLSHYFIFISVLIASWSLISHCKSTLFRRTSILFCWRFFHCTCLSALLWGFIPMFPGPKQFQE